jgi:hypothetical protein
VLYDLERPFLPVGRCILTALRAGKSLA